MMLDGLLGHTAYPYQMQLYRIRRAPEGVDSALVSGQTASEALQMPGDVDEYTFAGQAGEFFRLNLAWQTGGESPQVEVHDAGTGERLAADFRRFSVPRTGTYRVTISRPAAPHIAYVPAPLPYQITLLRIATAPEGRSAAISLGDTVSESLDPHGDIDEYTFTGTEGAEVVVLAEAPEYASVDLHRAGTGERLARVQSWRTEPGLGRHASPRIRLPATGTYRVRVWHDLQALQLRDAGTAAADELSPAYRFSVVPISRAPETAPAAFAIGDTVTEALSPKHDVDIFTFTAQAGEPLVLWGERLNHANAPQALTFFVTRADAPESLAFVATAFGGSGTQAFTAPLTGTYRVVVWPANAAGLQSGTVEESEYEGGYRFSVRRPAP